MHRPKLVEHDRQNRQVLESLVDPIDLDPALMLAHVLFVASEKSRSEGCSYAANRGLGSLAFRWIALNQMSRSLM